MSRPVIGAIHGWAMHGGLFADLLHAWPDEEPPDWRRLDLPGHGLRRHEPWPEDPEALAAGVVRDLPAGSWLVGWSLGGQVALQAALAEPSRYRGLMLISATPCFLRRPHWPHGLAPELLQAMIDGLGHDPEAVVRRFLALELHGSSDVARQLRRLRSLAAVHGSPEASALLGGLEYLAATDLSDRLQELHLPVLLIAGRRDRLVPPPAAEETARRLHGARLVPMESEAHAPFLTRPREVAGILRDFVNAV